MEGSTAMAGSAAITETGQLLSIKNSSSPCHGCVTQDGVHCDLESSKGRDMTKGSAYLSICLVQSESGAAALLGNKVI